MLSSSPLVDAVFSGSTDEVRRLLGAKADVNERDDKDNAPLLVAAYKGEMEVAWLLVDAGAQLNVRDQSSSTPQRRSAR